jgi:hypothetical protein
MYVSVCSIDTPVERFHPTRSQIKIERISSKLNQNEVKYKR